jgi:hypothetical protein
MSKRTHILRDHIDIDGERYVLLDATPEQVLRWLHKHHRTQAFAAIRRAAAVARDVERCKEFYGCDSMEPYRWLWMSDADPLAAANAIRHAIRAAIGSEKA